MKTPFDFLVAKFILANEIGHFNKDDHSIMLYGIKNEPVKIAQVKSDIAAITSKCKVLVLDPKDEYTNINIVDIGL